MSAETIRTGTTGETALEKVIREAGVTLAPEDDLGEGKVRMKWHVDDSQDPPLYQLICPAIPDLVVSVSSADVTERVARAKLITMAFEAAEARGIKPWELRFKVNGSIY